MVTSERATRSNHSYTATIPAANRFAMSSKHAPCSAMGPRWPITGGVVFTAFCCLQGHHRPPTLGVASTSASILLRLYYHFSRVLIKCWLSRKEILICITITNRHLICFKAGFAMMQLSIVLGYSSLRISGLHCSVDFRSWYDYSGLLFCSSVHHFANSVT